MNDRFFLDTNVLIYAHTDLDLAKQNVAQRLIETLDTNVSTQVLQELANTLRKKFKHEWTDVRKVISEIESSNNVFVNQTLTIHRACELSERYQFSFYDCLILAVALESGCSICYSEDMNDGQGIEKKSAIKNPFR